MGKFKKLLLQILKGSSDANIRFKDLCSLLTSFGFTMRVNGSYHIFRRVDIAEKINI